MATIWLTYAWKDNETGDVDFAVQEVISVGLDVKLDGRNIEAGSPCGHRSKISSRTQLPAMLGCYTLLKTVWGAQHARKSTCTPSIERSKPVVKAYVRLDDGRLELFWAHGLESAEEAEKPFRA